MACNSCGKNKCCCTKVITQRGPRGLQGKDGLRGPAGVNGTNTIGFQTSGILETPVDLTSGLAVCPITIPSNGDYVFDFTINSFSKSSAVDTFYLRTIARKNGVNLASPISDYIKTTVLPKASALGALSGVTHNHKIKLTGLIAGDVIAFWSIGEVEELSASLIYIKI